MSKEEVLDEKLIMLKNLGLNESEINSAKNTIESLGFIFDSVSKELKSNVVEARTVFSTYLKDNLLSVIESKKVQFEMMEEDKNRYAISKTVALCFGDVVLSFCKKYNVDIKYAEMFKINFSILMPGIDRVAVENEYKVQDFFTFLMKNDK